MNSSESVGPFDAALAASLLPALVALADRSALLNATSEADPDARAGKLEVGKQATQLRSALAALRTQAQALPAGNLSLDDQAYLIERLEEEVEKKREALASLAKLVPAESTAIETTSTPTTTL